MQLLVIYLSKYKIIKKTFNFIFYRNEFGSDI